MSWWLSKIVATAMKLTYLSHSCFFIETAAHRLIIDPFLTNNPLAQTKPDEIECDHVLVTHGHFDHVGDAVEIAKRNDATIIAPYEVADFLAQQEKVKTHPMGIGGARFFGDAEKGTGFRVKLTIAFHSAGYAPGGELKDGQFIYLGNPAGILLTADGKTLYHAGDTALTLEMKLLGELNKIDVALLPIGDNFTMGPDDAAIAAEFLKAGLSIPIHYNTFGYIKQDPQDFVKKCEASGLQAKALNIGESLEM